MTIETRKSERHDRATLVLGGTGKTGRRIAQRLIARGVNTCVASRSGHPRFDWYEPDGWDAVLDGVGAVYLNYAPDLAIPGATDSIRAFVGRAIAAGVDRLVLLSGRGEEEAQACERIVQETDVQWTVVRASWFMQNFSDGEFLPMVRNGAITLPAADVPEPFVDVDDIADVAVAALTEARHAREIYEVTGPRLLTFDRAAREISEAAGREVVFQAVPREAFAAAVAEAGTPPDAVWLLDYLFATVLDGRNAHVADGVRRALGREPRDFSDFARRIAASGAWNATGTGVPA